MKLHPFANQKQSAAILAVIAVLLLASLACSTFSTDEQAIDQAVQQTVIAVGVQQTVMAQTLAGFEQQEAAAASQTPAPAPTAAAPTAAPQADLPSATPTALPAAPTPAPTETAPVSASGPELERWMSTAKILLFEDMSGSREIRYVKKALDDAGSFYVDVGSAKGWFKNLLLSGENWDLIIASAEARRNFGGEYFEYIYNRTSQGAATIVEFWDLDSAPQGMAKPLLDLCGIEFQDDWYEPDLRTFWWLVPDDPIFIEPNEIGPYLRNTAPFWRGDIGDLLQIRTRNGLPEGDARLLAGTNREWPNDHGLLATCLGGRMIFQTFGSHEYRQDDIVSLWQNYIYSTLKGRYEWLKTQNAASLPPTPAGPQNAPTLAPPQEVGIGTQAACGWNLQAEVPAFPQLRKDLFEHHADGAFLILELELVNTSNQPIQIWDGDYFLEGLAGERLLQYVPNKAATGYLYIENPAHLYQDQIAPGIVWRTTLAFDVDPQGSDWVLVIRPGADIDEPMCEARIALTR